MSEKRENPLSWINDFVDCFKLNKDEQVYFFELLTKIVKNKEIKEKR